ncbi:ABC transporter permease [Salsipaludibacter albus]|uniref:ABC transporter permease n=1 Tax=Salsipaludibacter albus TaxID=2849650 RepID=UPI001EE45651|nr:ABC transporter permease [Salsipaludibacter albus]MBY5162448.1 ABC transporter permease [Salsipaludibacter albus]
MTTTTFALRDTSTMLRREFRRTLRYPVGPSVTVGLPIVFLLLFVYVLGDTLGAGLAGPGAGRDDYLDYLVPGMLVLTIASATSVTPVTVAIDRTAGIMDRFRTMAIARSSVLAGHVLANVAQAMVGMAVLVGIALLLGFSPTATPVEWLVTAGLLALATFALIWFAVALGLVADSVETASNLAMPLVLLPFLGSGFVPTESLPTGLRWFAEYQPFTPIIETVRGLLLGTAIGWQGVVAVAWCLVITVASWRWARHLFHRDPT